MTNLLVLEAQQRSLYVPTAERIDGRPTLRLLLRGMIIVWLCLATITLGVSAIARLTPVPLILELPRAYLPGSPPPSDMTCETALEDYVPRCAVKFSGTEVYFYFHFLTRDIVRSIIPAKEYVLGQLVVSWGNPAGVSWNSDAVYVYWEGWWATIEVNSFRLRPDSPVRFIIYGQNQSSTVPWQGFWHRLEPVAQHNTMMQ